MVRVWDDSNQNHEDKGRFSKTEEEKLKEALEVYRQEEDLTDEQFYEWIIKKKDGSKSFWPKIAEALPDRSVRSVKSFCQRKFHPHNYRGKWTQEDEQMLTKYVEQIGEKWSKIGEYMDRTEHNVRDKWREIQNKSIISATERWTIEDVLKLISFIEEHTDTKIISDVAATKIYYTKELEKLQETKKRRTEASIEQLAIKNAIHANLAMSIDKVAELHVPNWKKITHDFKTSFSHVECRNKWFLLFKYTVKHRTATKRRLFNSVIERLLEVVRMDKNTKNLDYYKEQPEFKEYTAIIESLKQRMNENDNLLDYLKRMKEQLNKVPIFKITKRSG